MKLAALLLLALPLWPQVVPTPPAPASISIPLPSPTNLPKLMVTAGGGYASPGGTFAYTSVSTLTLPQSTYLTAAQEYTLVKGQVQSCTFGGLTKPMYQFSIITIGITGLGGGCQSTSGQSSAAGSGQGFAHFNWGKLPLGSIVTVVKNTNSGWKVTLGFTWRQQ